MKGKQRGKQARKQTKWSSNYSPPQTGRKQKARYTAWQWWQCYVFFHCTTSQFLLIPKSNKMLPTGFLISSFFTIGFTTQYAKTLNFYSTWSTLHRFNNWWPWSWTLFWNIAEMTKYQFTLIVTWLAETRNRNAPPKQQRVSPNIFIMFLSNHYKAAQKAPTYFFPLSQLNHLGTVKV